MAVLAQHTIGLYFYEFTCQQWSELDEDYSAEWTVLSDTCGARTTLGNPYATARIIADLNGIIAGSEPIVITALDNTYTVSISPASSANAGSMSALDFQKAQTYLEPVSLNTTDADIPSGAVTSIDVVTALLDGEYRIGDIFSVINNENGERVKLTVTADTVAGDFTISAVGTAATLIPTGAILVPIYSERGTGGGGSGTVTSVAATAPAAGFAISGSPITGSGTFVFTLADDLAALEALASSGIAVRTGASTWAIRSLAAGTGISITDADGVSGNPTITNSAPDQVVSLTAGTGIGITGTYPNFTISATGGALSDGDYGDITVSSSGTVWNIDAGVVGTTELADSAVTYAKMQNVSAAFRVLGRGDSGAGVVQELQFGAGFAISGTTISGNGFLLDGGNTTGATIIAGTNDNNALSFETNNVTRVTISSGATTGGDVTLTGITANTSTVQDRIIVQTSSVTGVAAAGFGSGVLFQGESGTEGTMRDMARISALWVTATDASREAAIALQLGDNGGALAEFLRFDRADTSGTGRISLGTTGAITITNNVFNNPSASYIFGNSAQTVTLGNSTGGVIVRSTGTVSGIVTIESTAAMAGGAIGVSMGATAYTATGLNKIGYNFGDGYAPTSGTGVFTKIRTNGTYNQTGGASGIIREVLIQPTLTAVADFRGIELDFNNANAIAINQIGELPTNRFDGRVFIERTTAGTGQSNAFLNLNGGAITGDTEVLRASANISSQLIAVLSNVRNVGGTGDTRFEMQVGGTLAGDPYAAFVVTGGTSTVLGVDNSDLDKFKITPGGTKPGSTVNKGLTLTTDAATLVGVNLDAPKHEMDVSGKVRGTHLLNTGNLWNNALCTFGTGAGTGPTIQLLSGGNNFYIFEFTTGTTPTNNARIAILTFPIPFPIGPTISVFSPRNATTATDITKFFISSSSDAALDLFANGTLTASTQYKLMIHTGGYNT